MLRFSTNLEWRREPSRRTFLSGDNEAISMRKLVYSLAMLGTILFAVSAALFSAGHNTSAIRYSDFNS